MDFVKFWILVVLDFGGFGLVFFYFGSFGFWWFWILGVLDFGGYEFWGFLIL